MCCMQSTAYETAFALDTFNRLAMEHFDVRLADMAAGIGHPETVEKVLHGAGFSKVQVTLLQTPHFTLNSAR